MRRNGWRWEPEREDNRNVRNVDDRYLQTRKRKWAERQELQQRPTPKLSYASGAQVLLNACYIWLANEVRRMTSCSETWKCRSGKCRRCSQTTFKNKKLCCANHNCCACTRTCNAVVAMCYPRDSLMISRKGYKSRKKRWSVAGSWQKVISRMIIKHAMRARCRIVFVEDGDE